MKISLNIDDKLAGKTIKQLFAEMQLSTLQVKRFKYDGSITVNGNPKTVRYILQKDDWLVAKNNERLAKQRSSETPARLLYKDEYLYVASKPHGIATHPDRTHREDTLGNMLAATIGDEFALRVITRLDKVTSGCVLGALDEVVAEKLNSLQLCHGIQKTYIALVDGKTEPFGEIRLPLARMDGQNKTVVNKDGKQSETLYEAVAYCNGKTLLHVTPQTGRTHQIRAHLSAIGHPIVGDELYGGSPAARVMLHCQTLQFVHPITGTTVCVSDPCPFANTVESNYAKSDRH